MSATRHRVLDALRRIGPSNRNAIAAAAGIDHGRVSAALGNMQTRGMVRLERVQVAPGVVEYVWHLMDAAHWTPPPPQGRSTRKRGEVQRSVLELLHERGQAGGATVAQVLGLTMQSAVSALRRLAKHDRAEWFFGLAPGRQCPVPMWRLKK
jgi:predicted ArsR family transcriptional regulator